MKKEIRILFTSVGRRVELMQAYHLAAEKLDISLMIYGADITDSAPALRFCNVRRMICRIKDKQYIPMLLEICEKDKIDAVIPTIDTDLLLLSQNKKRFSAIGTIVVISDLAMIQLCRDKRLTADFFNSCGLESPVPVDDYKKYKAGYPAFIKPKDGSSSINAYKINSQEELFTLSERVDDYIIQPFIQGKEYTIDIFCDFEGNPIYITPRERLAVRSGEVLKTRIEQNDAMIAEMQRLIEKFKPCGAITVQLIRDANTGENNYIEINPRYGGGAPLSIKAGADSAEAMLKLLSGESIDFQPNAAMDQAVYSRFDQSICVTEESNIPVKAVIFDLDDTLYSEKEYVGSGFQAVAEKITQISDVEERLWYAFKAGKPAIDFCLKEAGIYSENLAKECLEVYRCHVPNIHLYAGVQNLFNTLREKNIKIGILTDGRPEGQRNKIQALGLEDLVDEIVITDEIGGAIFRKPCDIPFRIMQKKLGVPFESMVYVGDNPQKDFIAPNKLGMRSVWFDNSDGLYTGFCNVPRIEEVEGVLKWL